MLSGRRPDVNGKRPCKSIEDGRSLVHESMSDKCLGEELCLSWKFVCDALHSCPSATKLRGSSTRLHGVSEQSRLFEPPASSKPNFYFRNLNNHSKSQTSQKAKLSRIATFRLCFSPCYKENKGKFEKNLKIFLERKKTAVEHISFAASNENKGDYPSWLRGRTANALGR